MSARPKIGEGKMDAFLSAAIGILSVASVLHPLTGTLASFTEYRE